jgi:hypothetical protein
VAGCDLDELPKATMRWAAEGLESETAGLGIRHWLDRAWFVPYGTSKPNREDQDVDDDAELSLENNKVNGS